MDQNSDQIVDHIERQRDELGRDLDELQSRVKRTTDWRAQFEKHPFYFLGAAFGGGLLLSSMASGSRSSPYYSSAYSSSTYDDTDDYGSSSGYSSPYTAGGTGESAMSLSSSSYTAASSAPKRSSPRVEAQKQKAMDTLDSIKAALFTFAAAKAKEALTDMLPGFDQHLTEAQRHQGDYPSSGLGSTEDASSMNSPGATHGSGTSSGSSSYGSSSYGSSNYGETQGSPV